MQIGPLRAPMSTQDARSNRSDSQATGFQHGQRGQICVCCVLHKSFAPFLKKDFMKVFGLGAPFGFERGDKGQSPLNLNNRMLGFLFNICGHV